MKLHFEPNLDYQHTAIEAVYDLFHGQEICRTEFTVTRDATAAQQSLAFAQSELGIGNRLQLLDDEILGNLGDIQIRHGQPEVFNTDQGSQFTGFAFTGRLQATGVRISMDGRGRCLDNIFIERLWRSLKYEAVYLHELNRDTANT